MESALYGIFTLVGFASEISLVRCAHSFDFRYFASSCENPVRKRFPWSNLYINHTITYTNKTWRKKLQGKILEEEFPALRNAAASKIGRGVISLLRQLRCPSKPDHNKFSSLSNTTVVAIFPNLCSWRRSLYSNLGGNDPEKLYRVTLSIDWSSIGFDYRTFDWLRRD